MSKHILVVEDDVMLLAFLTLHLEHEGYVVSAAKSGEEMLQIFSSETIDLILLDLNLPDESGLVLQEKIRKISHVPIIIATANTEQLTKLTALNLGADDYLTKPFDPLELAARVRNVLGRSDSTKQEIPTESVEQNFEQQTGNSTTKKTKGNKSRTQLGALIGVLVTIVLLFSVLAINKPKFLFDNNGELINPFQSSYTGQASAPQRSPEKMEYQWALKAGCVALPSVPWWIHKSNADLARVVDLNYKGNWDEYIQFWKNEKNKLMGIYSRGNRAGINKEIKIEGEQLSKFIKDVGIRIEILNCLSQAPEAGRRK